MSESGTKNIYDPESEKERRIDHLVDTRGLSYADAAEEVERADASAKRRAETRVSAASYERIRAFSHAADTLFSLDD